MGAGGPAAQPSADRILQGVNGCGGCDQQGAHCNHQERVAHDMTTVQQAEVREQQHEWIVHEVDREGSVGDIPDASC